MIRILSSADWHINLHKKKVPYDWQFNRYNLMFEKLLSYEKQCDVHVIAGDLFDDKPSTDEVCLLLSYLNRVTIPTFIIPGNHEATSKGKSFWEHFTHDNAINNENVKIFTRNSRWEYNGVGFCFFPYGSVQTENTPEYVKNDILVTHIRGEVPPHISAEFDFERLRAWSLILLGDLHFNHKYRDYPAYYPGSPLNTTFDRDDKRKYGVDIIEYNNASDYSVTFHDLKLPKLIRRTVKIGADLTIGTVDHVIYEVTGSIDELGKLEKSDLLDKKMVEKATADSTLDLSNKSLDEELVIYLNYIKVANSDAVVQEFKKLNIT